MKRLEEAIIEGITRKQISFSFQYLYEYKCKSPQWNTSKWNPATLKGLYILYPSRTYCKNVRVVHSIKNNQCRMKEWKTGMVVSTDAEEAFQSNNFMIYNFF